MDPAHSQVTFTASGSVHNRDDAAALPTYCRSAADVTWRSAWHDYRNQRSVIITSASNAWRITLQRRYFVTSGLDLFLAPASSASYGHFSLPASFTAPRTITWADANVVLPQGGFLGSTKCVDGIDPATGILSSHVCAPISGYVSCTQATPCAAAGTTIYTVGASDSQIQIHANTSCTTTVAGATAILTLKYVDPSGTTQTITEPTATCTALGASSVASVTTTVRAQAASAVQYSVAIANAPHYETSVAVELEGN